MKIEPLQTISLYCPPIERIYFIINRIYFTTEVKYNLNYQHFHNYIEVYFRVKYSMNYIHLVKYLPSKNYTSLIYI